MVLTGNRISCFLNTAQAHGLTSTIISVEKVVVIAASCDRVP
jgi:hypothetical protein